MGIWALLEDDLVGLKRAFDPGGLNRKVIVLLGGVLDYESRAGEHLLHLQLAAVAVLAATFDGVDTNADRDVRHRHNPLEKPVPVGAQFWRERVLLQLVCDFYGPVTFRAGGGTTRSLTFIRGILGKAGE